jgi:hypothetical protein
MILLRTLNGPRTFSTSPIFWKFVRNQSSLLTKMWRQSEKYISLSYKMNHTKGVLKINHPVMVVNVLSLKAKDDVLFPHTWAPYIMIDSFLMNHLVVYVQMYIYTYAEGRWLHKRNDFHLPLARFRSHDFLS